MPRNRCAAATSRAIPYADYRRKYFGEQRIFKRYQGMTGQECPREFLGAAGAGPAPLISRGEPITSLHSITIRSISGTTSSPFSPRCRYSLQEISWGVSAAKPKQSRQMARPPCQPRFERDFFSPTNFQVENEMFKLNPACRTRPLEQDDAAPKLNFANAIDALVHVVEARLAQPRSA